MKVIIRTAETVTVYRSYQIEAEDVSTARDVSTAGLAPLGTRTIIVCPEYGIGAARESHLREASRYPNYVKCMFEDD
jgi:hypothetical protein